MKDPLNAIVMPHETFGWMVETGRMKRSPFHNYKELAALKKVEDELGKFAVYHGHTRLYGKPFNTEKEARARIDEIVGNKPACLKNYRIYRIVQLGDAALDSESKTV